MAMKKKKLTMLRTVKENRKKKESVREMLMVLSLQSACVYRCLMALSLQNVLVYRCLMVSNLQSVLGYRSLMASHWQNALKKKNANDSVMTKM